MRQLLRRPAAVPIAFLVGMVIASAATAGAATLISGKQIKDGTITSKDLSKAIRRQLAKAGAPGVAGAAGPAGSAGPAGAAGVGGPKGDPGPAGPTGATGAQGAPGADGSPDTAAQVLTKIASVDGSGSGLDADLFDGVDSSSYLKYVRGTQVNQTTALAAGGQEYWFTFGWASDQTIVWDIVPTVVGAKFRLEVETERGSNNTFTYWLRATNTGTVASGYQLRRTTLVP